MARTILDVAAARQKFFPFVLLLVVCVVNISPDAMLAQDEQRSGEEVIPGQPAAPAAQCRAFLCCHPLVFGVARHCYTKCVSTSPDGEVRTIVCRGGPSWGNKKGKPPNLQPDCPQDPFQPPIKTIDTYCGDFKKGHPDWPKRNKASCTEIGSATCEQCDCFRDIFYSIQKCCVEYRPLEENSNSSAYTALSRCSPVVAATVEPDGWVPGWGVDVIGGHDCDVLEAPGGAW